MFIEISELASEQRQLGNILIGKRMNCKIVEFRLSYRVLIVRRKTIKKKNIKINNEKNGG